MLGAEKVINRGYPLHEVIAGSFKAKKLLNISWWNLIRASQKMMGSEGWRSPREQLTQALGVVRAEAAITRGDLETGILPAGQVCGMIKDIPRCRESIEMIVKEAEEALAATGRLSRP